MRVTFYEAVAGILLGLALVCAAIDRYDPSIMALAGIGFAVLDRNV